MYKRNALCRFRFAVLLRQLYRLRRQLVRFEIIHVNAAQTALFGFHQQSGLIFIDNATGECLFCQFVQTGKRQVFASCLQIFW